MDEENEYGSEETYVCIGFEFPLTNQMTQLVRDFDANLLPNLILDEFLFEEEEGGDW